MGVTHGAPKGLPELTSGAGVEIERFIDMDAVEMEKFMSETVVVYVHPSREAGSLEVITPSVNGTNQPIIRGRDLPIKRKYVEALARCHTIKYEQRVPDPSKPDNFQMVEKKVPDYPFDVIQDTPKGKAWLKNIYNSL